MIDISEKFSFSKRNPRKEELLAKQREGQKLSREERAELRKHFHREKFSPEVNALWDRVEAGDPNVKIVARNGGEAIKVTSSDDEKIILTHGLGYCNSVLVYTEQHTDGTRNAVLTHYHPDETPLNLLRLRRLISKNPEMSNDASEKQIILFMPGLFKVKDQKTADLLASEVKTQLSAGVVDIKLKPYPEFDIVGKKDQGTLIVYIPPGGKGEARYRTWFSSEELGVGSVEK